MSKALQEQHEQSVGDRFALWLSGATGHGCTFLRRGTPKDEPDLWYMFKNERLGVEVTGAYYDSAHATFLWKGVREDKDAPGSWFGVSPDMSLASSVRDSVARKSIKVYAENSVLLINIPPGVTSVEELAKLLADGDIPPSPFSGIYIVGDFPITSTSDGGYRVLTLKSLC